jgi:septal ring factor EnvC (AmiA/AmiB activator)
MIESLSTASDQEKKAGKELRKQQEELANKELIINQIANEKEKFQAEITRLKSRVAELTDRDRIGRLNEEQKRLESILISTTTNEQGLQAKLEEKEKKIKQLETEKETLGSKFQNLVEISDQQATNITELKKENQEKDNNLVYYQALVENLEDENNELKLSQSGLPIDDEINFLQKTIAEKVGYINSLQEKHSQAKSS